MDQNENDPLLSQNDSKRSVLKETVIESLKQDFEEIKSKIFLVISPKSQSENALQNWDLFGPLIMCVLLSVLLAATAPAGQMTLLFTGAYLIVSIGGSIVTANLILVGANVAFFQAMCAVGYCLFPIIIGAAVTTVLPWRIVRLLTIPTCFFWAIISISRFLYGRIDAEKKWLGLYPCVLLYLVLSWIILIH